MGCDAKQRLALAEIEAHEAEIEHLQVPQAAVDDACRGGCRAAAEIAPLEERHPEAAQGRITRNPAADDAPADDGQIERFGLNACKSGQGEFPVSSFRTPALALRATVGKSNVN